MSWNKMETITVDALDTLRLAAYFRMDDLGAPGGRRLGLGTSLSRAQVRPWLEN